MIFIFCTLLGSVSGLNSGVYPVQREDYVWNGEPLAAPYHAYPARPENVYRVSRQEFRPLPYFGYYVPPAPRTEVWYPPAKNNYEYQTYQPSQIIPQTFSSNGYVPQLFVPAANQVFSSPKIPDLNIGQSSSRRPISPHPSEATTEDDSVLSATRKSSIDEGEPLPPLSEYFKSTNDRPIKKYIPFNDDVEINIEQKDLLKTQKPIYMEKREPDSQVERFRRQIMHIIEVPKQDVVESIPVNASPDQTEPPLSWIDIFYRSGIRKSDTALFLSDPEQYDKVMEKRIYSERNVILQPEFVIPSPEPSAEEEEEEVLGEEQESFHWDPNPSEVVTNVFRLPIRYVSSTPPANEDLFYTSDTVPQFSPIDRDPSPTWDDDDNIDDDTSEGNEERLVYTSSHIDVANVEKLFHTRFNANELPTTEATESTVTDESTTVGTPLPEEIITATNTDSITTTDNDGSSSAAEEEWEKFRSWLEEEIQRKHTTTPSDEVTDHPTETVGVSSPEESIITTDSDGSSDPGEAWKEFLPWLEEKIRPTQLPDEVTGHPTETAVGVSSTESSNPDPDEARKTLERIRSWLEEEIRRIRPTRLSDEVTGHPTETMIDVTEMTPNEDEEWMKVTSDRIATPDSFLNEIRGVTIGKYAYNFDAIIEEDRVFDGKIEEVVDV